ncbi:transmembrane protein 115-like protein [Trifolium pratense]|nr:transmembrane protein 115-like protein [Trifolium pratense]
MSSPLPPPPPLPLSQSQGTRTLSSVSVSGFTRLCKGLSLILVAAHLLLNFFPPAINYLALIPAR